MSSFHLIFAIRHQCMGGSVIGSVTKSVCLITPLGFASTKSYLTCTSPRRIASAMRGSAFPRPR